MPCPLSPTYLTYYLTEVSCRIKSSAQKRIAVRGGAGTPTQAGGIHTHSSPGGGLAVAGDSQCIYEEGSLGQWKEHWSASPETWLLVSALTFDGLRRLEKVNLPGSHLYTFTLENGSSTTTCLPASDALSMFMG